MGFRGFGASSPNSEAFRREGIGGAETLQMSVGGLGFRVIWEGLRGL